MRNADFAFEKLLRWFFPLCLGLVSTEISFAATDISRFSGMAGFAQSASKSAEAAGTLRNEGPLGFEFSIDHSWY